jgi:hypothetical protein
MVLIATPNIVKMVTVTRTSIKEKPFFDVIIFWLKYWKLLSCGIRMNLSS